MYGREYMEKNQYGEKSKDKAIRSEELVCKKVDAATFRFE